MQGNETNPVPLGAVIGPPALYLKRSDRRAQASEGSINSKIALAFLFGLAAVTALFYVAGLQLDEGATWAADICDNAIGFCQHPEWSGIPAVLMCIVFLSIKGMELKI